MNTMTNFTAERLKTIREAAQAYYPQGTLHEEKAVSAFIRGAKWADDNPKNELISINKVCEYLESAIRPYMSSSATYDFVDNFRKGIENFK